MRAHREQSTEIAALVDAGVIRAIVDRVLAFVSMAYVEAGRARGNVVVTALTRGT